MRLHHQFRWLSQVGYRPGAALCAPATGSLGLGTGLAGTAVSVLVRIVDNIAGTTLLYLFLSLLYALGALHVLLQDHDPIDGFDNPILGSPQTARARLSVGTADASMQTPVGSRSPREFWGRRDVVEM